MMDKRPITRHAPGRAMRRAGEPLAGNVAVVAGGKAAAVRVDHTYHFPMGPREVRHY